MPDWRQSSKVDLQKKGMSTNNLIIDKVVPSSLYLRWSPWQRDSQDGIRGRILIKPTSSHVPPLLIYFLTFIIFCDTVNMVLVTPKSTINLNKHSPRVHLQFGTVTWTFSCEMPKILYNVNTWQFPQKWMEWAINQLNHTLLPVQWISEVFNLTSLDDTASPYSTSQSVRVRHWYLFRPSKPI